MLARAGADGQPEMSTAVKSGVRGTLKKPLCDDQPGRSPPLFPQRIDHAQINYNSAEKYAAQFVHPTTHHASAYSDT